MSTTFVGKNGRVYQRKFDHEEAASLHESGVALSKLARRYGVTERAVSLAILHLDPEERERENARCFDWRTTTCEVCGGPAMRLVGGKAKHNHDGRVLCNRCRGIERRESVRFDEHGALSAVRCAARDCANGERWQPPEVFPRGRRYRDLREGGFHNHCRACQARMKQAYRERIKVPCQSCGKPCLPFSEKGARRADSGLCRSCYMASPAHEQALQKATRNSARNRRKAA